MVESSWLFFVIASPGAHCDTWTRHDACYVTVRCPRCPRWSRHSWGVSVGLLGPHGFWLRWSWRNPAYLGVAIPCAQGCWRSLSLVSRHWPIAYVKANDLGIRLESAAFLAQVVFSRGAFSNLFQSQDRTVLLRFSAPQFVPPSAHYPTLSVFVLGWRSPSLRFWSRGRLALLRAHCQGACAPAQASSPGCIVQVAPY